MIGEAHPTAVRYSPGLLAFGALNALGGGYYGLTGAVGVPTEWLEGSPFIDTSFQASFFWWSWAARSSWPPLPCSHAREPPGSRSSWPPSWSSAWLIVQIGTIGYVSWMQPATAIAGVLILSWARSCLAANESLDSRRRPLGTTLRMPPRY